MKQSSRVRTTAYIVTSAWSLVIAIAGVSLPGFWLKALGFLPVIIVAAFWLFDYWLWAEGPFPRFTHTPDVRGTWKGTLISIRDDGTGKVVEHDPIPIFLTIDQTYLGLDIALMSAESSSRSFAATLQRNNGDSYTVFYHYTTTQNCHSAHGAQFMLAVLG